MGNANEGSSMTQIDAARAGTITREMAIVAEKVETTGWCGAAIHIGPARAYPDVGE